MKSEASTHASLGDFVTLQRGTTYKSALLDQDGPALLGLSSIQRNGGFRADKLRTYGGDSPDKLLLKPGDLYVALKDVTQTADLLGAVARVPAGVPSGRLTQDTVKLIISDDGMSSAYLYWVLRAPQYRAYCRAHATGTTNLSLARDALLSFSIPPPTESRLTLVAALNLLDDTIDSTLRLSSLLGEVAATYLHARLVQFVGAEEFDESEIGPVPAGWTIAPLASLAHFVNGKAFTKDANGRGRPIVRIKELREGVRDNTPHTDIPAAEEHLARHHDILFAWSGSLGVHRWHGPESLINQHIFKVIPGTYPPWFVYHWVREHMAEFRAVARDKATTMGHIQRRHLSEAIVVLPDATTMSVLDDSLGRVDEWQGVLASESASLVAVRDALLSKLISGEIRTGDTKDRAELTGRLADTRTGAKA
jgi:type I restriction enzyme, S subunit